MRLLRISAVPQKQLKNVIEDFNLLGNCTYEKALDTYFRRFIAVSDAFVNELNKTGRCVAEEVIINHHKLQNLWLKTHSDKKEGSQLDIIKMQIEAFKPDVIFVNTNLVTEEFLRNVTKNKAFLFAWDGFIKPLLNLNANYDLVLTCLDSIATKYQNQKTESEVLDFAFDERILQFITEQKTESLNFVGNLTYVHLSRQNFINTLVDGDVDFSLYLGNMDAGYNPFSRTILREIIQNKRIKNLPNIYKLQIRNKGQKYGLEMYQTIANTNSTLNFHGDGVDKACNMRLFEATGLGTCLITDNIPGLDKFFDIENEVVTFDSPGDLLDKVKYLENNPDIALKIGKAGQKKIMNKHLWRHRVLQLLDILDKRM